MRRSLTGPGVRQTLNYLRDLIPGLHVYQVPSGSQVFDWTVPDEWILHDAYIVDPSGKRILDVDDHGLHVLGYSTPIDAEVDLDELQNHLFSLEEIPEAIPYVTSYYERRWGFCLPHNQRVSLLPGKYQVRVDSSLIKGVLNFADVIIPGKSKQEILISTYVCHPMMANNELSGPVVATALARWLENRENYFTYRFVFVPETIGSIVYLSHHLEHLKQNVVAGYVLTCIGDERAFSFLPSRTGNTLADKAGRSAASFMDPSYSSYSFLDRGSDERQYCSPLADLPVASLMRSKYGTYREYHTSLDDFSVVTRKGLEGGLALVKTALEILEENYVYRAKFVGEPQLGKRGLYPTLSWTGNTSSQNFLTDFLAYADGRNDLLDIATIIGLPAIECAQVGMLLHEHGLVERWRPS